MRMGIGGNRQGTGGMEGESTGRDDWNGMGGPWGVVQKPRAMETLWNLQE